LSVRFVTPVAGGWPVARNVSAAGVAAGHWRNARKQQHGVCQVAAARPFGGGEDLPYANGIIKAFLLVISVPPLNSFQFSVRCVTQTVDGELKTEN
jgi:hypothetical protein